MNLEDSIETHLLKSLESPATPMTQADWDHIRHTVRQNLPTTHSIAPHPIEQNPPARLSY
jgi:hypothetical protein